jgi:hypothetical protein
MQLTPELKKIFLAMLVLLASIVAYYLLFTNVYLTRTLSEGDCAVEYSYYIKGKVKLYEGHYLTNQDELYYANRKLALCLCEEYLKTKDEALGEKILEMNKHYSNNPKITQLEQILENRFQLFDPVKYID